MVVALLVPALPALGACNALKSVPPPPQEVVIRIASDPGKPLKDAELFHSGKKVAVSDEEGVAKLSLTGKDGESFDLFVKCPEGFQSPAKPIQVLLRRLADPTKKPEYSATCPPMVRTVIVAVRAENGADLPIMHLGREVARTDASGAAHVVLKVKPEESFDLVINTSGEGKERLRPQSPAESFTVKDHDEVFVFDEKFDLERVRKGGPRRRGPIKIGGSR